MRENKQLRQGVRVSFKHNGSYYTGRVLRCHPGQSPDWHRYDVRVDEVRRTFSRVVAYQCQPAASNWEVSSGSAD